MDLIRPVEGMMFTYLNQSSKDYEQSIKRLESVQLPVSRYFIHSFFFKKLVVVLYEKKSV